MASGQRKVTEWRGVEPEASDLEELIGYNLKRAYIVVHENFREVLGRDGFSGRVFSALSLVVDNPNVTQSELARLLGIERSGLVAIVDDLEQRGFVKRTAVPSDRRVQALVPTQTGQETYAAAAAAVRQHEDTLLAGLTSEEKQTLLVLLKKIRAKGDKI